MTDPIDRDGSGRWRQRLALSARDAASRFWARAVEIATVEPSQSDGLATERARAAVAARGAAELRGGVAKIAQMTAYVAGPDAVIDDAARALLARAWDELPPMPAATARGLIEAELGAPIGTLFAVFEDTPMAAASIGQVHAATALD
ncbi:MAG TPA: AarF/UbiB family protein, partial [Kofleriaceae bacterium]|nr:AarF/UbiB family protein [Kofleriaceae bacterium]